jgi:hypothetical protein
MFAHKKNYGRAAYRDDPLPSVVHIATWDACLHCKDPLCTQLNYVVVSGQFFFSACLLEREKNNQ